MNFALALACIAAIETGCPIDTAHSQPTKYDRKVGQHKEVTRYQILPSVIKATAVRIPKTPKESSTLAWHLAITRFMAFRAIWNYEPTLQQMYALWNSPAYVLRTGKIPKHCQEKAERFANLYRQELPHYK